MNIVSHTIKILTRFITGIRYSVICAILFFCLSLCISAQNAIINLPLNGNANDVSGNNLNGTVNNATLTTDRFNNANAAYYFNGTNASISIPYSAKYNISSTGKFTIALWLQPALSNSICAVLVKSPYNANFYLSPWDYGLYLLNNKGMSGYANNNFLVGSTTMIANACWYHLAVTYNNGIWHLYLNGKLEAFDSSMTNKILQSGGGISLGKKGEADGDFFNGKLDDVKFYDTILDPVSIKKLVCYVGNDKTICKGDSVQLNGSGAGTPLWTPATGLNNSNILNPKASPGSNQNYILTLSNGGLCPARDTVNVQVTVNSINIGADKTICEGDSFVFNNSTPGNYDWTPVYAISNNLVPNPIVRPLVSTTYYVTVTNGACIAKDTIHFNVVNVSANAGSDKIICTGDTVQLNGSAIGNFSWSPLQYINNPGIRNPLVFPPQSMSFILTSIATTCKKTDTVIINVLTHVSVDAGNDTSICSGTSFLLNGKYGKEGNNSLWLNNYAMSDPTILNPIVKPLTDTLYVLRAGINNGCYGYDTMNVTIIKLPDVNAGPDLTYCYNGSGNFNAIILNYDSFNWTPVKGLSYPGLLNSGLSGNTSGTYFLTGYKNGCAAKDSTFLYVRPAVVAKFSNIPAIGIAPSQIIFKNESINGVFYIWNFGEGITDTNKNTAHIYINPGNYPVFLIAKDSFGCSDSISSVIRIIYQPYLYIPNAFTPDGDGLNDEFKAVFNIEAFEFLNCSVYSRWGELIFQTQFPDGKWWDGIYKNKPCQQDSYVYKLSAKDLTGKLYSLTGNVTLLR